MIEQHDEWDSADRRYFSENSMKLLNAPIEEVNIGELPPHRLKTTDPHGVDKLHHSAGRHLDKKCDAPESGTKRTLKVGRLASFAHESALNRLSNASQGAWIGHEERTRMVVTTRTFDPIQIRGLTAENRIWLAPMCQYSCVKQDGVPHDWHLTHLGARAAGGFGFLLTEASSVSPEGRISPEDAGIWNDHQAESWERIVAFVHSQGVPIGMQLAHAGRKASTWSPLTIESGYVEPRLGGWRTVGPSSDPFGGLPAAQELTTAGIAEVVSAFAEAAQRAVGVGFDAVEIHAAHGYLIHQFLSPISNHRQDEYGGNRRRRSRFVREVVTAIRASIPDRVPLMLRISATDWIDGGWSPGDSVWLCGELQDLGVDLVDVSSGGISPAQQIVKTPLYQLPFASQIRQSGIAAAIASVGLFTRAEEVERAIADGLTDVVLLGRAALRDPSWPQKAASELKVDDLSNLYPPQYAWTLNHDSSELTPSTLKQR